MNQQQKDQDKRNRKTDDNCTKSLVGINQFKPEPPK